MQPFFLMALLVTGKATNGVVSGYEHKCALKNQGVRCWGYNYYGQLGLGHGSNLLAPQEELVDFGDGFSPNDLFCGAHHICVISLEDTMKCWGRNSEGQLGYGDDNTRGKSANDMGTNLAVVELPSDFVPSEMALSYLSTCVLSTVGSVTCFGRNNYGQLGLGHINDIGDNSNEMGNNLNFVDLGLDFGAVKQIEAMVYSVCALSNEGRVKCWGLNNDGQLGLGDSSNRGVSSDQLGDNLPYTELGTDFVVDEISCGYDHCCALSTDSDFKCWGRGGGGQLGYGDNHDRGDQSGEMGDDLDSVSLGSGFVIAEFEGFANSNCAISTTGVLKCWGQNGHGTLGLGDGVNRGDGGNEMGDFLDAVDVGSGFSSSAKLSGGISYYSVCIFEDSSADLLAKCWGTNGAGQLGYGDGNHRGDAAGEMGANLDFISFGDWPDAVPTVPPTDPPTEPVCDAAGMVNVNWHDMLNENVPSPSLKHSEAITFEASSLSLDFSASLEYIGKSADGNFDDEFNLGTTYWIDFESFSSGADNIRSPGSCGNRRSANFSGPDFADLWTFPVNPADLGSATTADRMAYPPSDWTLNAVNCSTIKYSRTLSWADLTSCQDAAGNALISVENTNEALKLSGTFFVELISPYSMSTEGYFRTFPLVQQDFQIVLNKQVNVMASTGTQLFITSVMAYGREDDGTYLVTVLIQSADYVRFDLDDAAAVTAPSGITVSAVDSFVGDCLVSSSFTCGQIFTAKIAASCSGDDSVDLSGSYQFAFTPQCIVLEDGSTDPTCEAFKTTLDAAGKVALGVDASFVDQCDVDLFAVSFNGTLSFYSDDQFAVAVDANSDPFVIGQDTIFGKVTVSTTDPAITYTLSGVTIERVYVCTAANALPDISANGAGGCLSDGIDDGPHNVIGDGADPDYQGTIITSTELDEGRFSFLTFDTARTDIYVHVQALLDVTFATGRRRRVRMLLQSEGAEEGEANQFRSFVGTASVQQDEDTEDDDVETDGAAGCSFGFVAAMIVFTAWIWG